MRTLHEKLAQTTDFLVGVEVVSFRGSMTEERAARARRFISQVVQADRIDWISITDNAGGNPQLAPQALGKPALYAGKEVVIHLTCKDLNRNGLESEAWLLNSEGFHNVLAMTGDFPTSGSGGMAKPVFDIDSVALIALLDKMNRGFDASSGRAEFCIGAVASNYKLLEGEVVPQLLKLAKKVECGARFIINQVGYDARKASELRVYMDQRGMPHVPLIGNVYVLNPRVAQIFHDGRIPGIVLTDRLLDLCQRQGASPDGGRAFFHELAARQMAIFRGSATAARTSGASTISRRSSVSSRSSGRSRPTTGRRSRRRSGSRGPASTSRTPRTPRAVSRIPRIQRRPESRPPPGSTMQWRNGRTGRPSHRARRSLDGAPVRARAPRTQARGHRYCVSWST